jgi:hypothetical protein
MGMGISHPRCLLVSFLGAETFDICNHVGYLPLILLFSQEDPLLLSRMSLFFEQAFVDLS